MKFSHNYPFVCMWLRMYTWCRFRCPELRGLANDGTASMSGKPGEHGMSPGGHGLSPGGGLRSGHAGGGGGGGGLGGGQPRGGGLSNDGLGWAVFSELGLVSCFA